jgi:hypothetical protein
VFGDYWVTMRLFKLLAILIIIGSIYFYAKQQNGTIENGYTITTPSGVSIRFPKEPARKTFYKNLYLLGKSRLIVYQSRIDNQLLVLLSVHPEQKDIRDIKFSELGTVIHEINDTSQMSISNQRDFVQQSYRGIEYKAITESGNSIWCRTVKRDGQLFSLVAAAGDGSGDKRTRTDFFQSLRL